MDFGIFDTATLDHAKSGDMKPLIAKLRSGGLITDDERQFIANRLEGKKDLRKGPKPKVQALDIDVTDALEWLVTKDNWQRDAAVARVAELINETDRSVRNRERRGNNQKAMYASWGLSAEANLAKRILRELNQSLLKSYERIMVTLEKDAPEMKMFEEMSTKVRVSLNRLDLEEKPKLLRAEPQRKVVRKQLPKK